MMKPRHSKLSRPLGAAALAAYALLAAPARGEEQSDVLALDTVTVTATRVGESDLLRTPMSVTAFSEEYLGDLVIADVRDLVVMTPGLTIAQNTDLAQIYIRGIGSNNVFAGSDPSSTIHYDGVYLARPQSSFGNFLDVERIEVLRGPQGTLYGRNSVGGTINVISKRPSTRALEAQGRLTLGNEGLWRAETYVSGPLSDRALAGSLALQRSQRDPYRDNVISGGNDVDDEDVRSVRAQLLWKPTDAVEGVLRGDYYEDDTKLYGSPSLFGPPNSPAPIAAGVEGDARKVAIDGPSLADRRAAGTSLEVNISLGERWSLKSLSAYRDNSYEAIADPDATELDLNRTILIEDQHQLSQELNLVGNYERFRWFLGAFYMAEDVESTIEVQVRPANLSVIYDPTLDTDSWALFGQLEYDLTDRLALTIGGRYTEERKRWLRSGGRFVTGTDNRLLDLSLPMQTGEYGELTPRVGFEYATGGDALLYGSVSRGFKSGGFNITSALTGGYDPEQLLAYELGWKSRFAGRTQIQLSAFYYDYEDLQVQAFIVPGSADITNAASARVLGSELELLAQVTESFRVGLGVAYLDTEYDEYRNAPISGGAIIDASGNRLNNAPEWSTSLSAGYSRPLGSGRLRATAEYGWKSELFFTTSNRPRERQGAYGVSNASIGYESAGGQFEVTLWTRNITDEEYFTSIGTIVNTSGRYGPPRTYGVALSIRY